MSPSTQDLFELVEAATRAPSAHNTQPWRFAVGPDRVDLYADRCRALPHNDPDGRELVISCGAALFALRVAAADHGYRVSVQVQPDPTDRDLLARVTFACEPRRMRRWPRSAPQLSVDGPTAVGSRDVR